MKIRYSTPWQESRIATQEPTFQSIWATIKAGRYTLSITLLAYLIHAGYQEWRTPVPYPSRAVLQIEPPVESRLSTGSSAISRYSLNATQAVGAQIELMKSRTLLTRVVEQQDLDLNIERVSPHTHLKWLSPSQPLDHKAVVSRFEIPEALRGRTFLLKPSSPSAYTLSDAQGRTIAEGRTGTPLLATVSGMPLTLEVRDLSRMEGSTLKLSRTPLEESVRDLRSRLVFYRISDRPDDTMFSITLRTTNPNQGIPILQELIGQAIGWNEGRNRSEFEDWLKGLETAAPILGETLQRSETQREGLNNIQNRGTDQEQYRMLLDHIHQLERGISNLQQERILAEQKYTSESETIRTFEARKTLLQGALNQAKSKLAGMPVPTGASTTAGDGNQNLLDAVTRTLRSPRMDEGALGNRFRIIEPPATSASNHLGMMIFFGKATSSGLIAGLVLLSAQMIIGAHSKQRWIVHISKTQRTGSFFRFLRRNPVISSEPDSSAVLHDLLRLAPSKIRTVVDCTTTDASQAVCLRMAGFSTAAKLKTLVLDIHQQPEELNKLDSLAVEPGGEYNSTLQPSDWNDKVVQRDGFDLLQAPHLIAKALGTSAESDFLELVQNLAQHYDLVLIAAPPDLDPMEMQLLSKASPHYLPCFRRRFISSPWLFNMSPLIKDIERAEGTVSAVILHNLDHLNSSEDRKSKPPMPGQQ